MNRLQKSLYDYTMVHYLFLFFYANLFLKGGVPYFNIFIYFNLPCYSTSHALFNL